MLTHLQDPCQQLQEEEECFPQRQYLCSSHWISWVSSWREWTHHHHHHYLNINQSEISIAVWQPIRSITWCVVTLLLLWFGRSLLVGSLQWYILLTHLLTDLLSSLLQILKYYWFISYNTDLWLVNIDWSELYLVNVTCSRVLRTLLSIMFMCFSLMWATNCFFMLVMFWQISHWNKN